MKRNRKKDKPATAAGMKSKAAAGIKRKEKTGTRPADKPAYKQRISKREYSAKPKKREWIAGAGLTACLISFFMRIPLGRITGDAGMGFLAPALEVFAVLSVILLYGLPRSVAVLVRYRIRREMYKSARRVFKSAMLLAIFLGAAFAVGVFFLSKTVGSFVVLEHMSYLAVAAVSPAVFLAALMGVLRGYFQGMGTMIPTAHSRLLTGLVFLAAGLGFGTLLFRYGEKVAGLLRNEEYASAYGAMGAAVGLSVACLLGTLHLFLIYAAYSGTIRQQELKDSSRYVESRGQIVSMLITTAFPYILCALFYNLNYLADQRIFNYAVNVKDQGAGRVIQWGVYYGKYTAVVGILAVLCVMAGNGAIPKIVQTFERQEYREAQVRLGRAVHRLAVLTIPCAVFVAVLAEPVASVLFTGEIGIAVRLLQAGSTVILFFAPAFLFMNILQRIRKIKTVVLGGLLAFLVHLAVLSVLVLKTKMGILAVSCGSIAFYLTVGAVGLLGAVKYMKYSQEWLRTFLIPVIAAGVAGVIGLLLQKVLLTPLGGLITLVICLPICVIIYYVMLFVLKGVDREDVEGLPGGRAIASVAVKLHLLQE